MLTDWKMTSAWDRCLSGRRCTFHRRTTYLAVVFGRNVQIDQAKYYVNESSHARDRIDLPKEAEGKNFELCNETRKEMRLSTDHYRPAVRPTPSNDIPLVVKGGEELPARGVGPSYYC